MLRVYVPADGREGEMRDRLLSFVLEFEDCFERSRRSGHVTGSAWIVDRGLTHVLLHHHRKLDRWLQPGGHADGDSDVARVALREAREETGLRDLAAAGPGIYDLDVHAIPPRAGEPAHLHYDVRFAFIADRGEPLVQSDESLDLRWIALDGLDAYAVDDSVRRLASKTATLKPRG